jgi:ribosome-binding protein aMBF1 (putative translation factor)
MKEEMQLVQDMERADDRDSEGYVDKLEQILELKLEGISSLRKVGRYMSSPHSIHGA